MSEKYISRIVLAVYVLLLLVLRSIAEKDKLISTLRTRIDLLMIENEKALKESAGVERLHDQIQKLQT